MHFLESISNMVNGKPRLGQTEKQTGISSCPVHTRHSIYANGLDSQFLKEQLNCCDVRGARARRLEGSYLPINSGFSKKQSWHHSTTQCSLKYWVDMDCREVSLLLPSDEISDPAIPKQQPLSRHKLSKLPVRLLQKVGSHQSLISRLQLMKRL